MAWIWQSSSWPRSGDDAQIIEASLAPATERIGKVSGMRQGPGVAGQAGLQPRRIVHEAPGSFGIEGLPPDPLQMQAAIVASQRLRDMHAFDRARTRLPPCC